MRVLSRRQVEIKLVTWIRHDPGNVSVKSLGADARRENGGAVGANSVRPEDGYYG